MRHRQLDGAHDQAQIALYAAGDASSRAIMRCFAHIDDRDFQRPHRRKNKPVVVMSPFPTDYRLNNWQTGAGGSHQAYILEKFFDAEHFMVLSRPLTQAELFSRVCGQLEQEGGTSARTFYRSVGRTPGDRLHAAG